MAQPIPLYPEQADDPVFMARAAAEEYTRWSNQVRQGGHIGFPWNNVQTLTGPLLPGWLVLVGARSKGGKAQPLDAKVLTTEGWKQMGELRVGDALASVDGEPSQVDGVFPQGQKQIYRVAFSDGRSTECCADHLWRVWFHGKAQALTTEKVREMLGRRRYARQLSVDLVSGDFGNQGRLPLDPWLLGVLLGDGGLTNQTPIVTTADGEIALGVREALPAGVGVKEFGRFGLRLSQERTGTPLRSGGLAVRRRENPLTAILGELGLMGCSSSSKFIPSIYLEASRASRVALLQGLLDTDGYADSRGHLSFCTVSPRLAADVASLVRSVGGTCRTRSHSAGYQKDGVRTECQPTYDLTISHHDRASLVRLGRKRDRASLATRQPRLTFRSIEPSRMAEAQCILVSHPSHLYITDDFIVTHNSTFLREMFHSWVTDCGKRVLYVGTEQNAGNLRALWACLRLRLPSDAAIDPKHPDHQRVLDDVYAQSSIADRAMVVAEPAITVDIFTQWARYAYLHKCDVLMFDHFHRLEDDGASQNRSRNSAIRHIKNVAVKSNMVILVAAQLKNGEGKLLGEFEVPGYDSWAETAGLRRECDVGLQLWRPFQVGVTREQKMGAKDDATKLADILQPNTMAIRCDAHRYRETSNLRPARLSVSQGELSSWGMP